MTIRELYSEMSKAFEGMTDTPAIDARAIICHDLGLDYSHFMIRMNDEVPTPILKTLRDHQKRRESGEPVAYILGERGFYECTFKVSSATLIPRADTEILVENAIAEIQKCCGNKAEISILDLCCGTGCIGISVAKVLSRTFKKVRLSLSDLSEDALEVCKQNVKDLVMEDNIAVRICNGDLFEPIGKDCFDAILSNPPYIASAVVPTLDRQVLFEPVLALDGGDDGLDLVRVIAKKAPEHLLPGALLMMEIGYDQGNASCDILKGCGFENVTIIKDYEDCDRVVKGSIKY